VGNQMVYLDRLNKERIVLIWLSKLNNQYRIEMDESWYHERPEVRDPDRQWYERIPVRNGGHLYLYNEDPPILGLYTTQIKSARTITRKFPGLKVEWMEGEAVIYFPPELLDQIAEMAGAKKKRIGRKLSPEERAKLVTAGKAHQFTGHAKGLQGENPVQI
jgi:hypothetical protein